MMQYALLGEEKVFTRIKLRNHHLVIGHSTYLPPRLIQLILQLSFEDKVKDKPMVRIEHVSRLTSATVQGVIEGSLHAGFGFLPVESSELLVRTLFEEPLVACIPSGSSLASKAAIYPHDLDGEPMIAVAREPLPQLHREIEDHFAGFGIELNVVADAFAAPEAQTYVLQKLGTCLLAGSSVVARPGITVRPLSTGTLKRRSGVFIRDDNRSPLIKQLVDTVVAQAVAARLRT